MRYDFAGASGAAAEMLEVILQAWNGDFATMPNDGNLKATARGWKAVIKASLKKQQAKKDQTSDAGKKSAEQRQALKEFYESQNPNNQPKPQRASTSVNEHQTPLNENVKGNVNLKTPLIAPQGAGIGGGGNKFSFKNFAKAVAMAEKNVPEVITEEIGRPQVVWRCAEFGSRYSNLIGALVYGGAEGAELTDKIKQINVTFKPKTDYQALKLARAMAAMDNPGAAVAIANEVEEHQGEPGIYQTMQGKIKYIRDGNNVSNYRAFAQARKTV